MRRCWSAILGALVLTLAAQVVSAQSLADVARREEERRKQVKSGRVLTNADLGPVDSAPPQTPRTPSSTAAPAEDTATPAGASGPDEKAGAPDAESATPGKPREKRDEQYWRNRARDLRERLAKANSDVVGAESRLTEMDATPASPQAARERDVMAAALAKLQAEAQARLAELTRFEAFAQAQKIPPDWTR